MTKGRAALPLRISCVDGWKQQVPPLRYATVGMTLLLGVVFGVSTRGPLNSRSLHYGRDDTSAGGSYSAFPRGVR